MINIFQSSIFNFLLENYVEIFIGISPTEIKEQFMKNLEGI